MKYTIVIPVFNRFNYLKITLATLREALRDVDNTSVLLCNFSGVSVDLQILKEIKHEIVNSVNVNVDVSSVEALKLARKYDSQYYVILDSDGVCHPNLIKGYDYVTSVSDFRIGSVFNAHIHSNNIGEINENVIVKSQLGGFGIVFKQEMLDYFFSKGFSGGWDWSISGLCNSNNIPLYCTKNSYLEHIGYTGTNSPKTEEIQPCQIARAINFLD